ncbi:MAG: formate dehydrogenase accessory sulfurtransferase FdhD [Methanosarcinales archaeon]|nr:formate dehydrogenase accessory sulfurtransferase FdhD [Methanosarcinales archaeon]
MTLRESWHADRIEERRSYWREERLEPGKTFRKERCIEIEGQDRREVEVDVAAEVSISIRLNGETVATLSPLPGLLREMAVGFLICEGLVDCPEDILSAEVGEDDIDCWSLDREEGDGWLCQCRACGSGPLAEKPGWPGWANRDTKMKASVLLGVVDQLNSKALLWRRTGATHMAMICNADGRILAACEDVSRSCAVDKTVGSALLSRVDLSRCALVTSGRLSRAMVAKAFFAGFPIVVSKAAPLESGIDLARRVGMTLVAFARPPRLYVYAGEERIIDQE